LIAAAVVGVAVLWNRGGLPSKRQAESPAYTSFRDIPGVTDDEISAIGSLQTKYGTFVYGMPVSTEAFMNRDGEIRGYSVLFAEWLSRLFDVPFTVVNCEWADTIEAFKTGKIHFNGSMVATEERSAAFFQTGAIAQRSITCFRLSSSRPLADVMVERPVRIGVLEGTASADIVVASLDPGTFEAMLISENADGYDFLKGGKIDAYVHSNTTEVFFDAYTDVVAEPFYPLVFTPVSLTAQNPEFKPIISVVKKALLQDGTQQYLARLYNDGYDEYRRHKFYSQLTDEEYNYIKNNPVVTTVMQSDNYPLSFFDERTKQWNGIASDILGEVGSLTGLSFQAKNSPTVPVADLISMLERREASLISGLIRTPERTGRFLWPENTNMANRYALISTSEFRDLRINEVFGVRVGLLRGSAHTETFRHWFPYHDNNKEYDSLNALIDALDHGEIDVIMQSESWLRLLTNYRERPNFKANIVFDIPYTSSFGFNKDEAVLCSIVDKALNHIGTAEIARRWMSKTYDYRAKLTEARLPWLLGATVLLLCVLVLLGALFQSKHREGVRLDGLVRKRTAALEAVQKELETAVESEKAANQSKSTFLTNMSHEIRTPMNTILGVAEIRLRDGSLESGAKEAFQMIHSSGDLLLGIINDILDLSKIETGNLELDLTAYDVASLINDTATLNMVRIGDKPIEFTLSVDENTPATLFGDELRIKQILNNLLSNAFKYTRKGQVKMSVSAEARSEDGHDATLFFVVSDTGQGMTEEQATRIFDKYARFNIRANRSIEGTGLGMSITRKLVDMMEGEISVKSEINWGTVVTVRLPQGRAGPDVLGREVAENLRNFRIRGTMQTRKGQVLFDPMPYGKVLIVDDVELNLYVAKGLMAPYGLSIETAESGFEAIEKIKEGAVYDIVFMDHMMPKMDGIEATKNLRSLGYTHPVVALTANAVVGQADVFLANGFDDFLSKPIDIRELYTALTKFVRNKQPPEALDAAQRRKDGVGGVSHVLGDSELTEAFVRDARKAVETLEAMLEKSSPCGDDGMQAYIIAVHSMKTALGLAGEAGLSAVAAKLEEVARDGNTDVMSSETPGFLRGLRAVVDKFAHPKQDSNS